MELRGTNPPKNVFIIIPARFESVRLPGKLLLKLEGRPLVLHTLDRAREVKNVTGVIVATDNERIYNAVAEDGGHAVMTKVSHRSGSDRIAEVAETLPSGSIIVNLQGDEPLISPLTIDKAVGALQADDTADMSTTCERIRDRLDVLDPNIVKVVSGQDGYAQYFSRSPVPFPREAVLRHGGLETALQREPELIGLFQKHTGLYVYRREFLLEFASMGVTELEDIEKLEQLRALENGARIRVVTVEERSIGVDTIEDLERVRLCLQEPSMSGAY